jgi:hypothetical protein
MAACGSTASTTHVHEVPTADFDGPPWELLDADDAAMYVDNYACVQATEMMTSMMDWPTARAEGTAVEEVSPGRFVDMVHSESGLTGLIQYREGETRVFEMGMLMLDAESMIMFLNYDILRAFHTGAASPDDEGALELATGDYFCVYM